MAESKATAPDFSLELDVDMTLCIELRARLKETAGDGAVPSYNDMVVKAAALALREHPKVNGAYRDGTFELYPNVNVGIAVAAQDALVVPVVRDADQKSLGEIARQARALIERVRDGEITPPELSGGTFTVSNLGMYGIERFTAIVNPPQAAILTVGALMKKPAVDERGRVVARDQQYVTFSAPLLRSGWSCWSRATTRPFSSTAGFFFSAPTDRIDACGGLMIAVKRSIPYIPRLDTVIVPPESSGGVIEPVAHLLDQRACLARDLAEGLLVGAAHHRHHQRVLRRHGHAHVHLGVELELPSR